MGLFSCRGHFSVVISQVMSKNTIKLKLISIKKKKLLRGRETTKTSLGPFLGVRHLLSGGGSHS